MTQIRNQNLDQMTFLNPVASITDHHSCSPPWIASPTSVRPRRPLPPRRPTPWWRSPWSWSSQSPSTSVRRRPRRSASPATCPTWSRSALWGSLGSSRRTARSRREGRKITARISILIEQLLNPWWRNYSTWGIRHRCQFLPLSALPIFNMNISWVQ